MNDLIENVLLPLLGVALFMLFSRYWDRYRDGGRLLQSRFGAEVIYSAGYSGGIEVYLLRSEDDGYLVGVEIAHGKNWPRTSLQPHSAKRLAGLLQAAADAADPGGKRELLAS